MSIQDAWALFEAQSGLCALTGTPLRLRSGRADKKGTALLKEGTASLDRIDSAKGYEPGNVQWVHKHVNIMKLDLTQPEFIAICRSVVARVDRAESANPAHNSPTGESTMRTTTP